MRILEWRLVIKVRFSCVPLRVVTLTYDGNDGMELAIGQLLRAQVSVRLAARGEVRVQLATAQLFGRIRSSILITRDMDSSPVGVSVDKPFEQTVWDLPG